MFYRECYAFPFLLSLSRIFIYLLVDLFKALISCCPNCDLARISLRRNRENGRKNRKVLVNRDRKLAVFTVTLVFGATNFRARLVNCYLEISRT